MSGFEERGEVIDCCCGGDSLSVEASSVRLLLFLRIPCKPLPFGLAIVFFGVESGVTTESEADSSMATVGVVVLDPLPFAALFDAVSSGLSARSSSEGDFDRVFSFFSFNLLFDRDLPDPSLRSSASSSCSCSTSACAFSSNFTMPSATQVNTPDTHTQKTTDDNTHIHTAHFLFCVDVLALRALSLFHWQQALQPLIVAVR